MESTGITGTAVVPLEDVDMLAGLLSEVVAHWDLFLGHLGVSPHVRDEIRHDNANKPRFCQRSLLDGLCRWVESEEQPSYGRLTAALRVMAASELLLERVQHFAETHTCPPLEPRLHSVEPANVVEPSPRNRPPPTSAVPAPPPQSHGPHTQFSIQEIEKIDPKDLRFVVRALHSVCKNWRAIGDQLDIDNLDIIRQNYSTITQCLIAMVDSLLRGRFNSRPGSPASWQTIVRVVGDPAGGDSYQHATLLAAKLNEFRSFTPGPLALTVSGEALVGEFPTKADLSAVVARLVQLLQPIAARWFEVGALLGLPLGESLTSIRHDPSLESDTARLRRVLEEWLLHAERWGLEVPSWQVLVDVLAHGAGGDDPGLAQTLAQRSLCADGTVAVEPRSHSVEPANVVEPSPRNRAPPTSAVPAPPPQSHGPHTQSSTEGLSLSPACSEYASFLRHTYLDTTITSHQKWPPVAVKKYINLASIDKNNKRDLDDFTKAAAFRGDIDAIVCKKEPFQLKQLAKLPDGSKPKLVLVEGAPGAGKSTFAWKFCRQWGKRKLLGEYPLLVLLRLREKAMQDASSIADLFYHPKKNVRVALAHEIEESEGEGLLLVLEGFDEAAPSLQKDGSLLMNIISGRLLPKATILVTSRPSATAVIHRTCASRISQHIEVLGFTKEDINSYIQAAMPQSAHSSFEQYLSLHPHIKAMMYNPLHCAIAVEVYKVRQAASKSDVRTITELYKALLIDLLLRYLYAHPEYKDREWTLNSFTDLPSEVYTQLCEISRLAYEGTCKGQTTFLLPPGKLETLGLLQDVPALYHGRGVESSYSFLHLTVQEFLTAFHLSRCDIRVLIQVFREEYRNPRWQTVLRFLAGLTRPAFLFADRSLWQRLKVVFRIERNSPQSLRSVDSLSVVHWVHESQNSRVLEFFFGDTPDIEFYHRTVTPFDCYELGFCVAQCGVRTLELEVCSIDKEDAAMLALGMKCQEPANIRLKQLSLLRNDDIGRAGAVELLSVVAAFPCLITLNLWRTNIDLEDCQVLGRMMSSHPQLMELDIGANSLSSEAIQLVISGIGSNENTKLEKLILSLNTFSLENTEVLSSLLMVNNTIKHLDLRRCGIGPDGSCLLAAALKNNSTLKYIDICGNIIDDKGGFAIASALKVNRTLKHIIIRDGTIGAEGICQLVASARYGLKLELYDFHKSAVKWHHKMRPNISWL